MKIFFDTNVYVAEALLGEAAEEMLAVTERLPGESMPAPMCWMNSSA